jgi:hypothetical protein
MHNDRMMSRLKRIGTGLGAVLALGCQEPIGVPRPDVINAPFFARLSLSHKAVLMSKVAPYDTLQLSLTLLDSRGNVWHPEGMTAEQRDSLLAANPVRYTSSDNSIITVSQTGLVKAISTTTPFGTVRVVATQQIGLVTRADTALIRVFNTPVPLVADTLRLRPDSTRLARTQSAILSLRVVDGNGVAIPGAVTFVTSSDSTIVGISGALRGLHNALSIQAHANTGKAMVRAVAHVYGRTVRDSFEIEAKYPITGTFLNVFGLLTNGSSSNWLDRNDINISVGGTIQWRASGDTIVTSSHLPQAPYSIVFDDPSTALAATLPGQDSGPGNITAVGDTLARYRRFVATGEHKFTVQPYGYRGTITVK